MTVKEFEDEARNYLASAYAEMIAAMRPVDAEKWGLKPVWVKPDGDGWDVTQEPVRFEPVRSELFNRRGYENVDEIIQLRAQLEKAQKAGEAIDALLKEIPICPMLDDRENIKNLIYAEAQPLREQLETARKALERIDKYGNVTASREARIALAQIGAGQKGGE